MQLHESTFEHLKPTEAQLERMANVRAATHNYAVYLSRYLPDGADKTYVIRKVREIGMWANVSITRDTDGSPRN